MPLGYPIFTKSRIERFDRFNIITQKVRDDRKTLLKLTIILLLETDRLGLLKKKHFFIQIREIVAREHGKKGRHGGSENATGTPKNDIRSIC